MNVSETDKEIRITAESPGVTEQDIDFSLDDDVLTMQGEKKLERKDNKEIFHFVERSYGTFQCSLRLPYAVESEQVQASFENGVLTVTVSKTRRQERSRRIRFKAAAQQVRARRPEAGDGITPGHRINSRTRNPAEGRAWDRAQRSIASMRSRRTRFEIHLVLEGTPLSCYEATITFRINPRAHALHECPLALVLQVSDEEDDLSVRDMSRWCKPWR
jgi:HSP20 family molecular chaperone IbpA